MSYEGAKGSLPLINTHIDQGSPVYVFFSPHGNAKSNGFQAYHSSKAKSEKEANDTKNGIKTARRQIDKTHRAQRTPTINVNFMAYTRPQSQKGTPGQQW